MTFHEFPHLAFFSIIFLKYFISDMSGEYLEDGQEGKHDLL